MNDVRKTARGVARIMSDPEFLRDAKWIFDDMPIDMVTIVMSIIIYCSSVNASGSQTAKTLANAAKMGLFDGTWNPVTGNSPKRKIEWVGITGPYDYGDPLSFCLRGGGFFGNSNEIAWRERK